MALLQVACAGPESGPEQPGLLESHGAAASPRGGAAAQEAPGGVQQDYAQPADLIDPAIPPGVAGESGWNYVQASESDLTGDGEMERVVLTARVELYEGRPAWDDGQPWQVYVEAADGSRTYLYAQRLQLGTLTMRLGTRDSASSGTVVLLEHLPDRLSVYEALYEHPGSATTLVRFQRKVDPRGELASPQFP